MPGFYALLGGFFWDARRLCRYGFLLTAFTASKQVPFMIPLSLGKKIILSKREIVRLRRCRFGHSKTSVRVMGYIHLLSWAVRHSCWTGYRNHWQIRDQKALGFDLATFGWVSCSNDTFVPLV